MYSKIEIKGKRYEIAVLLDALEQGLDLFVPSLMEEKALAIRQKLQRWLDLRKKHFHVKCEPQPAYMYLDSFLTPSSESDVKAQAVAGIIIGYRFKVVASEEADEKEE